MVHPYNGILLRNIKDQTHNLDESQKHYAEWKKPVSKFSYHLMVAFIWYSQKKKTTKVTENRSVVAKGERWKERWVQKNNKSEFMGNVTVPHLDHHGGYTDLPMH